MMYRRKQTEPVDAISFEEFIAYGLANSDNIRNGMPWSFQYKGYGVTHHTDDRYIIAGRHQQFHFARNEVMFLDDDGLMTTMTSNSFHSLYEAV